MSETRDVPGAPDRPERLGQLASYLLNRIIHRYNQTLQGELKQKGVTTITMRTVVSLKIYGELTVNELCVHAIAEQPTMSRTLDKMEGEGLIAREISDKDQRVRVIRLTDVGHEFYDRIWPVMTDANEALLKEVSPEDRAHLMRILMQILGNIRQNPF
ncbi:MarR family winged helix-turn-helix transcriptional regulator [Aliisedimentitalea scapharcae]|uniref:MarR family winged helix-turn-helix transcriptional regulator n=1 Tax=Aliisedimentitalea scapharcae TaxID=1524259 RepID=A0ABZ2XVL4_9RHOB|nr:MarR family winged helix-turn-helix transcriptional regulator [Rhodobacteraceae bacterium M382]